jgi:hypothetical protein
MLAFSTKILPLVTNSLINDLKIQAINEAKNQMEYTLSTGDFSHVDKDLTKRLHLTQSIENKDRYLQIKITVRDNHSKKILHRLYAYAAKE